MRRLTSLATVALCLVLVVRSAGAACDGTGPDAADVATARVAIAAACDCDGAPSPAVYKRCAKTTARDALANDGCLRPVVRCAAKSTCGRPGAAVCCRTTAAGVTKGSVVRSEAQCRAPRGGSACVGAAASICDACDADGCTAESSECGNGAVETGEQCDGQPYCTGGCTLAGIGCCQGANVCRDFPAFLSSTLTMGCAPDTAVRGTCDTGGTCEPTTIEPDVLCCASGGVCSENAFGEAESYTGAAFQCLTSGGSPMIGGSCGDDGSCRPNAPRPSLAGMWMLSGTPGGESCPAPAFESILTIARNGATAVSAAGVAQFHYTGTTNATGVRLFSSVGPPTQVPCPGGFYEANLLIDAVPRADGTFAVTQSWSLLPPVMIPGCPFCTKSWTGTATSQPIP
jgi:hypothetical protein